MGECKKPHAILVPFPLQGHMNPMIRLAEKLVDEGFLVSFLNIDHNHPRCSIANNYASENYSNHIRWVIVPDSLAGTDSSVGKICHVTEQVIIPFLEKFIAKLKDKDEGCDICLVTDVFASMALDVATRHRVPMAALWTSLTAAYAISYTLPSLVSTPLLSNGDPKDLQMVKLLPFMPPVSLAHLPWVQGFTQPEKELLFHFTNRCMERTRQLKWVLFNTFHSLEAPVIEGLVSQGASICPVGPLMPSPLLQGDVHSQNKDEIPKGCLEWLDKQSPQSVIYVSFGSLAVLNEAQIVGLALGLQAIQRPFLWVARSDLLDVNAAVFPPGFLEATKNRRYVVSLCPQLTVLSHSSIACFVTHCGWNSVLESVCMGVPMLCWPRFGDQFLNCDYVVNVWKVGLALNPNAQSIIEMNEFKRAVERVITGGEGFEMKKRAAELRNNARSATQEGGSSSASFREFVNAMLNRSHGNCPLMELH